MTEDQRGPPSFEANKRVSCEPGVCSEMTWQRATGHIFAGRNVLKKRPLVVRWTPWQRPGPSWPLPLSPTSWQAPSMQARTAGASSSRKNLEKDGHNLRNVSHTGERQPPTGQPNWKTNQHAREQENHSLRYCLRVKKRHAPFEQEQDATEKQIRE